MKQIPNVFTLLNLVCGCIAIMYALQPGLVPKYNDADGSPLLMSFVNDTGVQYINIPEQIQLASLFIGIAAVIDFLDGFLARLLKATSEMGKQLDSLSDVVSFGVAPAMILLQLLRLAYAQQPDGLDVNIIWLMPVFVMPAAGAYRLARFNIDSEQSTVFKGVPIPAVGLLVASFPVITFFKDVFYKPLQVGFSHLLSNTWFLYAVVFVLSYLMISSMPMMALKFKRASIKSNGPRFLLILAAIVAIIKSNGPQFLLILIAMVAAIILQWLAVPVVFVIYVVLSLLIKQKTHDV